MAEHQVKVEWVHFSLHPDTPPGRPGAVRSLRRRNVDLSAMQLLSLAGGLRTA